MEQPDQAALLSAMRHYESQHRASAKYYHKNQELVCQKAREKYHSGGRVKRKAKRNLTEEEFLKLGEESSSSNDGNTI